MRKPPGTFSLKKFGPGKIWVENVSTQNTCILAFLHTFVLISGNPTKTQNIFINFLTELDDFKKIDWLLGLPPLQTTPINEMLSFYFSKKITLNLKVRDENENFLL